MVNVYYDTFIIDSRMRNACMEIEIGNSISTRPLFTSEPVIKVYFFTELTRVDSDLPSNDSTMVRTEWGPGSICFKSLSLPAQPLRNMRSKHSARNF